MGIEARTCDVCHAGIEPHRPDPCLGYLPGVLFACCGHNDDGRAAYVLFENGVRVAAENFVVERLDAKGLADSVEQRWLDVVRHGDQP